MERCCKLELRALTACSWRPPQGHVISLLAVSSAATSGCPGWTGRWASSSPWRSHQTGRSSLGRGTSSGKSWASCCPFSAPTALPPGPCLWRKSGRLRLRTVPRTRSGTCLGPPASQRGNERASPFCLQPWGKQQMLSRLVAWHQNNPRRKFKTVKS